MLDDIIKITQEVFSKFIDNKKQLKSPQKVYDTYRALSEVVRYVKLVEGHYLALDFTEGHLQNSSFGEPINKWRYFFNKDLKHLNESLKHYLLTIYHLSFKDDDLLSSSLLPKSYNCKTFFSFVRDEYNVGLIDPCNAQMISKTLDMEKFNTLDLSSYESRVSLQKELQDKAKILNDTLQQLKEYILKRYTLEDML